MEKESKRLSYQASNMGGRDGYESDAVIAQTLVAILECLERIEDRLPAKSDKSNKED